MLSKSIRFFGSNASISIIYLIISILAIVVSNNLEGFPSFIVLLLYALLALNFFITGNEIIKEENNDKSMKASFLRFDKDIIMKIFILVVFLSAILLIFKGPMILIAMTPLNEKITALISESKFLSIAFAVIVVLSAGFYKMFFLTSVANVIYFKGDTMESLKGGFKTTFKLKTLLLLVILIGAATAFIPFGDESRKAIAYFEESIDIILKPLIFLMAFYYFNELEKKSLIETNPNK
jgi:hypothetical protein